VVSYQEKDPATFQNDLVSAIADGQSPDLILADAASLFVLRNRLYTIPFETYNERLYRDTYVDGASVFLSPAGVLAIPLLVDPLVVYYNKDLLAGQNYVAAPTTWNGLGQSLARFLKKDSRGVITQTAIGLGEVDNVQNYKDILSALFLQTGNPIVVQNPTTGAYEQRLNRGQDTDTELGSAKALSFYTGFANQSNTSFSWTRTLPSTLDMFLSGKSAFYIGRASELFMIQSRNPNLSFDVTTLFQPDDAIRPITYGNFSGLGILKSTPNFPAAYSIAGTFTSKEFVEYLSAATAVPPARRDLLLVAQKNPYVQVYFKAALSAFGWPDPSPALSTEVFRDMIRAVNNGRSDASQAIYEASRDLQSAIR
jgi:ABC-type glycerol-3-phosphate transport system substrate-binding protein